MYIVYMNNFSLKRRNIFYNIEYILIRKLKKGVDYLMYTLNLKGFKNFEKKVFDIMDENGLIFGENYKANYETSENVNYTYFLLDMVTKNGTVITIKLEEYEDYEYKNNNDYNYQIFIEPLKNPQRIINLKSPIDLIECLYTITSTI